MSMFVKFNFRCKGTPSNCHNTAVYKKKCRLDTKKA